MAKTSAELRDAFEAGSLAAANGLTEINIPDRGKFVIAPAAEADKLRRLYAREAEEETLGSITLINMGR